MNYKAQVFVNQEWVSNGLVFEVETQARAYAKDLFSRWMSCTDKRTTPVDLPATHTFLDGRLAEINEKKTLSDLPPGTHIKMLREILCIEAGTILEIEFRAISFAGKPSGEYISCGTNNVAGLVLPGGLVIGRDIEVDNSGRTT
jgi:hypothetical protein